MDAPPPVEKNSTTNKVVQGAISLVLVVAIFVFVLPQVADLSEVWDHIRAMTWLEVTTLAVAAAWNLVTYGFVWVSCLPGLTVAQALVATEASTAVANTVPGGSYISIGLTYQMLHSWGFRRSVVTLAMLISGIWNNFAKLAIPVFALAALAVQGEVTVGRIIAAGLGIAGLTGAIVVFALALRTEAAAAKLGNTSGRVVSAVLRLLGKPPATGWDIAVTRFREKTIGLLRTRWLALTVSTIVSHLSLYLVLLLSLRHIGVSNGEAHWAEVLAVFAFARLVTAIPLTPGGLGVIELALIGGLSAAGGDREQVVAAVLVYRLLTYVLPIPLGVACYGVWRRNRSWRKEPQPSPTPAAATP
ncbi:MAG: lysylphosphatidylglycerol synthase transmembrane domain-containing protein [Acidimicrobiales bacterium]